MTNRIYPDDPLNQGEYEEDDGTMPDNVQELEDALLGRKIVKVEQRKPTIHFGWYEASWSELVLTLDNGKRYVLADTNDCCAYTELQSFLLHPENIDHAITSVETQDGYTKWFILADMEHVLDLEVEWSAGNPFYYGYGFDISVMEDN